MGDLLFCALAAQQQGEPAEEAVEERANCAPVTHNQYKSNYRPKNCKTFVRKILRRGSAYHTDTGQGPLEGGPPCLTPSAACTILTVEGPQHLSTA